MTRTTVTEPDDPRLDDYRFLRDRDLRRHDEGLFVGEQLLVVQAMLRRPGIVRSVLASERMAARIEGDVPPEVPLLVASDAVLERVVGFAVHRGLLAVGRRDAVAHRDVASLLAALPPAPRPATVLLLEDIANIDNMGQLFRNAAAFGVDAVLLSPRCHDPLYRRVLRVSIGLVLDVPWARSDDWPGDLERLRHEHGFRIAGAALRSDAMPLDDLPAAPRTALAVGTEFAGLSDDALARCDRLVRIPMAPGVDSLNVAAAAAVCLHRMSTGERS